MKRLKIVSLILLFYSGFAHAKTESVERFKLVLPTANNDETFLLDSQTGKIWRKTCLKPSGSNCVLHVWIEERIQDITIDKKGLAELLEKNPL